MSNTIQNTTNSSNPELEVSSNSSIKQSLDNLSNNVNEMKTLNKEIKDTHDKMFQEHLGLHFAKNQVEDTVNNKDISTEEKAKILSNIEKKVAPFINPDTTQSQGIAYYESLLNALFKMAKKLRELSIKNQAEVAKLSNEQALKAAEKQKEAITTKMATSIAGDSLRIAGAAMSMGMSMKSVKVTPKKLAKAGYTKEGGGLLSQKDITPKMHNEFVSSMRQSNMDRGRFASAATDAMGGIVKSSGEIAAADPEAEKRQIEAGNELYKRILSAEDTLYQTSSNTAKDTNKLYEQIASAYSPSNR